MSPENQPKTMKTITRSVKHTFKTEEIANLNTEFRQAFANLKAVEAEFDKVKASYKAKTTEAESIMETLNATLQAGFEYRDEKCVVVLNAKDSKKLFFLELIAAFLSEQSPDPLDWPADKAAIVEAMTAEDFQKELVEAESKFELFKEITIFPAAGNDFGVLAVGRLGGKWFSALRVTIGGRKIEERLDSEQSCSKKRSVQIDRSLGRFLVWVEEQLGREAAKGFKNHVELVKADQAELEE